MDYLKMILAIALISASAHISYDFVVESIEVPFSAQSLMIMIVAAFLSPKQSVIIVISYLVLGGLGLPIFSEGSSGWESLLSGSGGFLYGFVFVAYFISINLYNKKINYNGIVQILLIATLIMFSFGVSHLSLMYSFSKALQYGFYPFLIPSLIKVFVASLIIVSLKSFNSRYLSL